MQKMWMAVLIVLSAGFFCLDIYFFLFFFTTVLNLLRLRFSALGGSVRPYLGTGTRVPGKYPDFFRVFLPVQLCTPGYSSTLSRRSVFLGCSFLDSNPGTFGSFFFFFVCVWYFLDSNPGTFGSL